MLISIVVPVLNEANNVAPLYERLRTVLTAVDFELIFVDDGSTDDTSGRVASLHDKDPRVKLLSFSRNFGHQMALTAGMDYAQGEAVILMDGDLQHPPEPIPEMIRRWREGFQIVYTLREMDPAEPWLKSITSRVFYKLFNWVTPVKLASGAADFRLMDRAVVDVFRQVRERGRFLRGLTGWVGFRSTAVPYQALPRHAGSTKYGYLEMVHLALNAIVSFSAMPLYVAILAGFLLALMGFVYSVYALYVRFVTHQVLPGWTSLIMLSAIVGGIQLIVMGFIGAYIGKIYDEVKQRPLYILQRSLGLGSGSSNTHL